MKINETVGVVERSGNVVSKSFGFELNKKAFEILSAGIYSDKVRAVIRELSTNAADAHVAAGKANVPFIVHLPNSMEPWFAVQDSGTGLSDNDIETIYTTYFKSNKTDSNDVTGCLGLGSKSPFAYTDSFTVESRFNGMVSVYNPYLDERGIPTLAKLSSMPTSEPNGLTVKFPVKSGDFTAFRDKAAETLQWFTNRPTVTGWKFDYPEREFLLKTEKFAVTKKNEARSYVIMGNIAYPIEAYDFLSGYDGESQKLRTLIQWGIHLYVGIGDVDISASREKLGYDKRTIRYLKDRLNEALVDMQKEVTKTIATQPSIWKARKALHNVRKSFNGFDFKAEWGGKTITDFAKVGEIEVNTPQLDGTIKMTTKPSAIVERMRVKSGSYAANLVVKKDKVDIITADDTIVYLADERGAFAATRRTLEGKPNGHTILIISEYDQAWLDETGLSEVAIKTSTLPKVERAKGVRGQSTKAKLYEFAPLGNAEGNSGAAVYWTPAEVDPDEGGVYVEILYFSYRMKDGEATAHPSNLNAPLALLKKLGKDVKLYGIRPSDKKMLEESGGEWLDLKTYAQEVIKDKETTHYADFLKAKEVEHMTGGYYGRSRVPFVEFKNSKFSPESPFGQLVARLLDATRAKDDVGVKAYAELRQWADIALPDDVKHDGLSLAQESTLSKYPMLSYVDPYRGGTDYIKDATAYVNLLDG